MTEEVTQSMGAQGDHIDLGNDVRPTSEPELELVTGPNQLPHERAVFIKAFKARDLLDRRNRSSQLQFGATQPTDQELKLLLNDPNFREALVERAKNECALAECAKIDKPSFKDIYALSKKSSLGSSREPSITTEIAPGIEIDIPIIAAPMQNVQTLELNTVFHDAGGLPIGNRWMSEEEQMHQIQMFPGKFIAVVQLVPKEENIELAKRLINAGALGILVDVNISWTDSYLSSLAAISELNPTVLIGGNVDHPDAVIDLFLSGATTVKIGIGPASHCSTRLKTIIGAPQGWAVATCSWMARYLGIHSIADAGIKWNPNGGGRQVAMALAMGADFTMKGRVFAASTQGAAETKRFLLPMLQGLLARGMTLVSPEPKWRKLASDNGVRANYFGMASQRMTSNENKVPQGFESWVKPTGDLDKILTAFTADVETAVASIGASNLDELRNRVKFDRVPVSYNEESGHRQS